MSKSVKEKHILITGGTGYIGRYLTTNLLDSGHKVTSVSRGSGLNINHVCLDLSSDKLVNQFALKLTDVDIIIHCAAIAHGERPPDNYSVADFNTLITKNLLNAFKNNKIHWIFISSISVYGEIYSKFQIPITSTPKSSDSYGKGKLFDENLFISKCKHLDILRLMPVYDSENLNDIKKRVFLPKTRIKMEIRPSPSYSICNIERVLSAVHKALNYEYGKRLVQVGDPKPITQKDLLDWFSGRTIFIPQVFFKMVYFILPKNLPLFKVISFMLKKLALNNIYETGVKEID